MLAVILVASVLVAVTVACHAAGLAFVLVHIGRARAAPPTEFWPITGLLVRVAWLLLLIHFVEIAIWALFYLWEQCLPDAESAFYFSGVTYTTIGYGDLVLPKPWRLLGPIQGATGILMCGLSASFFFAIIARIYPGRVGDQQG
ncbi:MAG: potassium channel family protein [Phycisphaerae bacterium]|nr:potassium channel family protein [Tepidisphaeraceae bacterium]